MSRLAVERLVSFSRGPFDLSIDAGECVSLRGASGAGKTLLLRAIADLDEHTGEVRLDGVEARQMSGPAWRRQVGLLAAESSWWCERVGEHFASERSPLESLGLPPDVFDLQIDRLSTGERQRLAVARLLDVEPGVLLLDEPTASLDEANAARVEKVLGDYRERSGAAVFWVTHDSRQAGRVASRHFVMADGRLEEAG